MELIFRMQLLKISIIPHCASKRKKENHQFQKLISQISHSYPNMTISYQFWLHISIYVQIWLIESCSFYPKVTKKSIFTQSISEKKSYFLLGVPLPVYGWYHVKIQVSADPRVPSIYRKWDTQKEIWFFWKKLI